MLEFHKSSRFHGNNWESLTLFSVKGGNNWMRNFCRISAYNLLVHIYTLRRRQSCKGIRGIGHPLSKMGLLIIACTIIFSQQYRDTTILNSILYSLKTPDHWYMRYNIIIYKLQWFTGEGHKKGEAKYNKCRMMKINTKYIQMSWKKIVRKNRHCLGFFK